LEDMAAPLQAHPGPRLCIDHHVAHGTIDGPRLIDDTAEATAILVFEALEALAVPIDPATASALFVGVATDTGWFRFPNVRPRTFEVGARLQRLGAQPTDLYIRLYECRRIEAMKLRARVLSGLQRTDDGRVCYTRLTCADIDQTGARYAEAEEFVNMTLTVQGVELGLLFVELPTGQIKVSFRSRDHVDCSAVARGLGGGGHRRASGTTLDGPLENVVTRVLAVASDAVAKIGD